jgi:hypothetical protein
VAVSLCIRRARIRLIVNEAAQLLDQASPAELLISPESASDDRGFFNMTCGERKRLFKSLEKQSFFPLLFSKTLVQFSNYTGAR